MKRLSASEKTIICSNPNSIFRYFGWPSVTRLPDGTLAAVCSGFRLEHVCPFGKAVIFYSRDEGKTWTRPAPVIDTMLDDRDSGITVFGNGRVIMTSFNDKLDTQREWAKEFVKPGRFWEEGLTQSEHDFRMAYINHVEKFNPEEKFLGSTYCISEDGGYTFGAVQRVPVTAPHGPFALNDGGLMYVGSRYTEAEAQNGLDCNSEAKLQCWKLGADDRFEYVSSIPDIHDENGDPLSCEPHGIQLPSGKIIVHIRVQCDGLFTVYQSESDDNGKTFTKPHPLLERTGGAPPHLFRHSSGLLISVYGYRTEPYGIRAMVSRDEGETWETDLILDDTALNPDLGYPATVELKDGRLLTVYYENVGGYAVIKQQTWSIEGL